MGRCLIGILAALALIAPVHHVAAASKSPKLAKCDGKKRRPANPYGSILPSVDPVNGTSTPAGQIKGQEPKRGSVEVFPEKAPTAATAPRPDGRREFQVPPISSLITPTANQSC